MEVSAGPAQPVAAVAALRPGGPAQMPAAVPDAAPARIVTEDDDEMTFTDAWDDVDEWPRQFGAAGLGIP